MRFHAVRLWPIGTIDSHGTPAWRGIVSPVSRAAAKNLDCRPSLLRVT
jgi:hypothetical protein